MEGCLCSEADVRSYVKSFPKSLASLKTLKLFHKTNPQMCFKCCFKLCVLGKSKDNSQSVQFFLFFMLPHILFAHILGTYWCKGEKAVCHSYLGKEPQRASLFPFMWKTLLGLMTITEKDRLRFNVYPPPSICFHMVFSELNYS